MKIINALLLMGFLTLNACDAGELAGWAQSPSAPKASLEPVLTHTFREQGVMGRWNKMSFPPTLRSGFILDTVEFQGSQYLIHQHRAGNLTHSQLQQTLLKYDGQTVTVIDNFLNGKGDMHLVTDENKLFLIVSQTFFRSSESISRKHKFVLNVSEVKNGALEPFYSDSFFQEKKQSDNRYSHGSYCLFQGKLTLAYRTETGHKIDQLQEQKWQTLVKATDPAGQVIQNITAMNNEELLLYPKFSTQDFVGYTYKAGQIKPLPTEGLPNPFSSIQFNGMVNHKNQIYMAANITSDGKEGSQKFTPTLFRLNQAKSKWESVYVEEPTQAPGRVFYKTWFGLRSQNGQLFAGAINQDLHEAYRGIKHFRLPKVDDYLLTEGKDESDWPFLNLNTNTLARNPDWVRIFFQDNRFHFLYQTANASLLEKFNNTGVFFKRDSDTPTE